ncbi:MAG: UDP-N-acetylmuramoyl-L-alanyl-D-glutamate--2, 6-diaminopimelate ligase [Microgenomates bacterium 39_6]|nr:MAG: UDP-N-acetylmuramoyl-L-alanyl-D-glutamate--2, 6-diaminopimelate ligase [Microgenomates bacterium 39_6]
MIKLQSKNKRWKRSLRSIINLGYHLPIAAFWTVYYRYPARKLTTIGVTGTDGKTTTSSLIWHILNSSGRKTGLITSINAKIGQKEEETGFHVTTPNPKKLQQFLAKMTQEKSQYAVIEATSHGLDQYRLLGTNFYLGVITNITPEHLDYHQNMLAYAKTKAKLFKKTKIAILNRDDKWFSYLKTTIPKKNKIITYGTKNNADINPKKFSCRWPLPGTYNQYNCLAAVAAAKALGIKDQEIRKALKNFSAPKGRLEEINLGQNFSVFIDFAHTPNALKNVLTELKKQLPKEKKLIAVFGCAGLRDYKKRPLMGKIASELADLVIITSEDPRTEDPEKIAKAIARGCLPKKKKKIIIDRAEAIDFAIQQAQEKDIVVILGKGHEQSMCFGKTEYPWSDHQQVKKALKKVLNRSPRAKPVVLAFRSVHSPTDE